jgi:hypothetical protein
MRALAYTSTAKSKTGSSQKTGGRSSSPPAASAPPTPNQPGSSTATPPKETTPPKDSPAAPTAPSPPAQPGGSGSVSGFPDATTTGVPRGTTLRSCPTTITATGTYDACRFDGDVTVKANNVHITRSLIKGHVDAGDGRQAGLVISDSEIDCGCQSSGSNGTPPAIGDSNYTLLRVDIHDSGHGAAVKDNVVIRDSYIHGLGGNTGDHKDGIYSGDGSNVKLLHNRIECDAADGCTAAIGILTDFSDIYDWTIDGNLLNTSSGSYCFYGSGGPQKRYSSYNLTFTNNHFGRKFRTTCGAYGPVVYWDSSKPGMVWSGNVWDDTGQPVAPKY